AKFLLSGDQSNSYTYMSGGEMDRAAPVARVTIARRCSMVFEAMTPDSGAVASVGPGTRVMPSIRSSAMLFPSGDQCGSPKYPSKFPTLRGLPRPGLSTTYNCIWPCE